MKILSISSILPVPELSGENDFVIETYRHYRKHFPGDEVIILKPVRLNLNPLRMFRSDDVLSRIRKLYAYELEGLRVEVLPFISAWRLRNLHALASASLWLLNRKRISALWKKGRFDVIHAQFILPDGLLARKLGKRFGIPYLVTTHNERFYFDHALSRRKSLKVLGDARAVLPLNHFNYSYFKSIHVASLRLLPIGFDGRFLKTARENREGPLRILSVCSLIPLKNIDQVIRAVNILREKYAVRYTIVGRGPEREKLEALSRELGLEEVVHFSGAVPYEDMDREMYAHDLFIMPSFFETFGRVYFEAMAMGIPVICARNSGIFGFFREDEEGLSVDHRSVEDIAAALEKLVSDPRKRRNMGLAGQKLVAPYVWEKVVKELREYYSAPLSSE